MKRWMIAAGALALSACDCSGGSSSDAGFDAGSDARSEAGEDAAIDAGLPDVGMAAEEAIDLLLESRCRHAALCTDTEAQHRRHCHPEARARSREARIRAIAGGELGVDESAIGECRRAAEATRCADALADCGALSPGRAAGESCLLTEACRDGTCTGLTCPTTCTPGLAEGAACASASDCSVGLTCGGGGLCIPRTPVDGACSGPLECVEGAVCDGTCRATTVRDEGASCDVAMACRGWLFCRAGTCIAGGEPGAPCDFDAPCRIENRCESGACVARTLPGAPCDDSVRCPRSHVCVDGTCTARPLEGQPCSATAPCLEGVCTDGACVLSEAAAVCAQLSECRSSLCLRGLCARAPLLDEACVTGCAEGGLCRFVPGEPRRCRPACD